VKYLYPLSATRTAFCFFVVGKQTSSATLFSLKLFTCLTFLFSLFSTYTHYSNCSSVTTLSCKVNFMAEITLDDYSKLWDGIKREDRPRWAQLLQSPPSFVLGAIPNDHRQHILLGIFVCL
jgi:hypothetical protein